MALHVRLAEPRSLYCPVHLYVNTLPKLNPLLSFCCEFFGLGGGLHLRSEMKRDYLSEVKQIIKYRLPHIYYNGGWICPFLTSLSKGTPQISPNKF